MTQGYGSQGQWARPGQAPPGQWAPVTRSPQEKVAAYATWILILTIAVVAVRALVDIIGFSTGFAAGAIGASSGDPDAALVTAGIGGILAFLALAVNGILSIALLVLAIMTIVQGAGRGRTGAIVIVAALLLGVVASWTLRIITQVIVANAGYDAYTAVAIISAILEVIRWLVICGALLAGAIMVRRWVAQRA